MNVLRSVTINVRPVCTGGLARTPRTVGQTLVITIKIRVLVVVVRGRGGGKGGTWDGITHAVVRVRGIDSIGSIDRLKLSFSPFLLIPLYFRVPLIIGSLRYARYTLASVSGNLCSRGVLDFPAKVSRFVRSSEEEKRGWLLYRVEGSAIS